MSEFSFDPISGPLRAGPTMLLLDPFTPNERMVREDSPEGQEWLAAHPPSGRKLVVRVIDYGNKSVTIG